jgi:DNA topoisomerase-3
MKQLIIAEKPSVARDISKVLHCTKKNNSYIEGDRFIVTWALGHLVTLADPEQYGEQYKTWDMETLPMLPSNWKLVVIKQTGKQFQAIKNLIHRSDISDVIIATDAGREGELVARLILDKAGNKKPFQRLWISSVTDKAIREGFANLKPGKNYDNLYKAAFARAQSDWIVGINATRALTCKYNAQLSCGRVQTPTLAMLSAREKEIRTFTPESFYGMKAIANGITFTWNDKKTGAQRTFNHEKLKALSTQCIGSLKITELKIKEKKSFSPALYDLTTLQRDANQQYGLSAKETLNIMQRLYENHKVLTYPRTDSRYLTSDMTGTLKERLRACAVGPYNKPARRLTMLPIKADKSFVDDNKVSDHHAIIPTEQFVQLEHMSNEERKVYDLVVRRFLAILSPPCIFEETSIWGTIGTETFSAKGNKMKQLGWREIYHADYRETDDEEVITNQVLPDVQKGEELQVSSLTITEGKTKPPAYFTEGTLLSAMENPSKYMQHKDKTLIKTLGETGGLGTVATRADIIEKLFHSFLMEKKGKEIHLTSKGKQLLELVPQDLKKPELTADWELRLQAIAKGDESNITFIKEIESYTRTLIQEIKAAEGKFRHDNLTRSKCPQCGKYMLEVNGKHGKMLVCQDRECGHRETVARRTNARCPVCHKKMDLTGKGDAQRFICSCGHKERLSAFEERRKKEGKGASKRDVSSYLKNQEKSTKEPVNNAFADAFSKLDIKL